jgi:ribonuclease HII
MPRRRSASKGPSAPADLFADQPENQNAKLEDWARVRGYVRVAGVDEVGRGPLAGPVVAAAVVLGEAIGIEGLTDSKKLTASRREELARSICKQAQAVGLGVVSPARIDETNIRLASLEAMSRALSEVLSQGVVPDAVLVDGRDVFTLPQGAPAMRVSAFIKGDARSLAIGAASIVAKVYRDTLMLEYHSLWPEYGFAQHKGYPTKFHRQALLEHGACEIHRRSFRGVLPPEGI